MQRVRGQAWGEVLRREVLEPLAMTRTTLLPVAPHATGWAVHPWADVLANVTTGLSVGALAADLLQTVAEREPRIPAPWRPLPSVDPQLLDLAGPWYWGPAPYVLRPQAAGCRELTPFPGGHGTRLRPTDDGDWEGTNGYIGHPRLRAPRDM